MTQGLWHYARNGQAQKPVAWEALLAMAHAGTLAPTDLVWFEGMADWHQAGTVTGLFEQPSGSQAVATADQALGVQPAMPPAAGYGAPGTPALSLNYYNPNVAPIRYAGFWIRFGAAFIDGLILLIPLVFLKLGVNFTINGTYVDSPRPDLAYVINQLLSMTAGWLYAALMQSSASQATLGMQAAGLRVADLQGQRLTFARATGRFFAYYLSCLTLGIGFLMIVFTERKQALHDMVAGTLVIRRP